MRCVRCCLNSSAYVNPVVSCVSTNKIWQTVIVKSEQAYPDQKFQLQGTKHFFILYAFCIRIVFVGTQETTGLTYADKFKQHLTHLIGYPKSLVKAEIYGVSQNFPTYSNRKS